MSKVRVYELAKELGTTSKKLIEVMESMNIEVSNHMSTLTDDDAARIMAILTGRGVRKPEQVPERKAVKDPEKPEPRDEKTVKKETAAPTEKFAPIRKTRKTVQEEKRAALIKMQRPKLRLEGQITVAELAVHFDITPAQIITLLLEMGVIVTINQVLTADTIELLAEEYGMEIDYIEDPDEEELLKDESEVEMKGVLRKPVVTVLGHVDHGKTSLLDAIRNANVTAGEFGGITQHIGAYQVKVDQKKIVFLDTPGHAAFTAMRARGAQITDIAVLVVAADDGVMPQTIEAVNHAKAAKVPVLVAINKIDKPDANPDRVKQQLSEHGLIPEEWGGDTIFVPVSATRGDGLEELLEMILLLAEVGELSAYPDRAARGTVIEAKLDRGRGPVATVLVQDGTLKVGSPIICGSIAGKVRAMMNDRGERIKTAGPSTPVEILGLNEVPMAGDRFQVVSDERIARQVAAKRTAKIKETTRKTYRITLDDLFKQIQEGEIKDLNLIIKGDVQGSVEALQDALFKLSLEEVQIKIIHTGVGTINESDVMLASASNAIVIGFNVRPDNNARKLAEQDQVDVRLYRIIYEAIEDINAAVTGMLKPIMKEVTLGQAQVRQLFKVSRLGNIAGTHVIEGKINRNATVRVIRDGVVVHESGHIASLKRFKEDVREVLTGFECGILLENFNDLREGDIIEAYTIEQVAR
ncbi:MAG TPA: translation initiation factor IF-2 [Candidatus Limnocylindrales bacterium]|nr:translation initiation factor IF-2 [Candidatus Limnocylindrales bacterium]